MALYELRTEGRRQTDCDPRQTPCEEPLCPSFGQTRRRLSHHIDLLGSTGYGGGVNGRRQVAQSRRRWDGVGDP
jgi:hypothetical protein